MLREQVQQVGQQVIQPLRPLVAKRPTPLTMEGIIVGLPFRGRFVLQEPLQEGKETVDDETPGEVGIAIDHLHEG